MGKQKWVINQKRQLFVQGPPKFTKSVSFPSAFRVTHFRLPVSGPLRRSWRRCMLEHVLRRYVWWKIDVPLVETHRP